MTNINKLEVIIETKELVRALSFANSVVEKRNVLSELAHIKLSAKNGKLEIVSTDMDLTLLQLVGAEIVSEGEVIVAAALLVDIAKKIPSAKITFKERPDYNQLEVLGENCNFVLVTLPVGQFPAIEKSELNQVLKIPCKDLARLIDHTLFSASNEETRYNLTGIYLHIKDNKLIAATTDGHRLSVATTLLAENAPESESFSLILPRKTSTELQKLVKDSRNIQSQIEIFLGLNKIKFICNDIVLISKLIDGTFPDYTTFIPEITGAKLSIKADLLCDSIERAAIVTGEKFKTVKIKLTDNAVEFTASGEAKGNAHEELSYNDEKSKLCIVEKSSGEDIEIGFNPKYLTDILNAIKSNVQIVELGFNDEYSPATITTSDEIRDIFVVMPVKI